ncbi:MAG TPA: GNAT family N-acetyltransferase [Opitutaceae bacterium]|nr:GNAT family N-acetyltransferase [Opitutaceae bacterium]
MPIHIRPFDLTDHAAAVRLWEETAGVCLSSADSLEGIKAFLGRNPGLSLVAVDDGEIVGTVLCGHDGRRGLLHHLAVKAGYRRRGLGGELVRRCLAALRARGIGKCHLFVLRDNADGCAFWRRLGAEEREGLAIFSLETR